MSLSTSQISVYLGGKVPSQRFVTALVDATVPTTLRERRLSEANRLLHEALHPPKPVTGPAPARTPGVNLVELAQVQALQIDTYERLTRSLEQQAELRQAADNSAKLIMVLLGMINQLQGRVAGLTEERDRLARNDAGAALGNTQRKLARAVSQKEKATQELKRAQEKQHQAENLASRLATRIEELTDELDRLRGNERSPHDQLPDVGQTRKPAPESEDIAGDDIDRALARVEAVNDSDSDIVDRITTELGNLPGSVPDNPSTSADAQDKGRLVQRVVDAQNGHDEYASREVSHYAQRAEFSVREYGPAHPRTLIARAAHAHWTGQAGDTGAARDLYSTLVADHVHVLGPDHRDTLATRDEHARWTGQAGDATTARDLYNTLVADRTRTLGPDHLDTLATRDEHARWTGQAGDAAAARDLYNTLVADRTRVQGPDHPDTLAARTGHARWTGQAGDATTARDLYDTLVADRTRTLGPDHCSTLASRRSHAHWTGHAGDAAAARDLYTLLVFDHISMLGPDHPHTLTTRLQRANWTGWAGNPVRARHLSSALAADRTRLQGPDHPDTLTSLHNHAHWTGEAGEAGTARALYTALVTDRTRVLGPDHPDTLTTRRVLRYWTQKEAETPW